MSTSASSNRLLLVTIKVLMYQKAASETKLASPHFILGVLGPNFSINETLQLFFCW